MMSLFANPNSSLFQNNPIISEWTENIEAKFMDAYNSTIQEYGADKTDVLDPCKMRESFGDINGISKCGESLGDYNCGGSAECFSGTVSRIIDGDTIVVDDVTVRFALASAPELSESGGVEAKQLLENICPVGSKALVDEDDRQTDGSYGRTIAKIYCNDVSLNEELVNRGFGSIDSRFCTQSEFSGENWAKEHGC